MPAGTKTIGWWSKVHEAYFRVAVQASKLFLGRTFILRARGANSCLMPAEVPLATERFFTYIAKELV